MTTFVVAGESGALAIDSLRTQSGSVRMWDFSAGRALGAMFRTWPFILLRMVVYFAIGLAYVVMAGAGAGTGWLFHYFGFEPDSSTLIGGAAGLGITAFAVYWFREYALYLVKAGHIAVLVEILDGKPVPGGRGQIAYAQQIVRQRFVESSALFAVDQLVKGVIRVITGTIHTLSVLIPIPGFDGLIRFANAILRTSMTYVDELILAYIIRTRTTTPWETARDGLVLYAQNYWSFAKNAIVLTIFMYAIAFAIFIVVLTPALGFAALMPGSVASYWGVTIAFLIAWAFKTALIEPFAIAALMQVYFKTIEGQTPDAAWEDRLTHVSDRFRQLKDRAAQAMGAASRPVWTNADR